MDPPLSVLTNYLSGSLAFLPAPTKDGWGSPHSSPDPGEGDACDGQLGVKSHVAKGLTDHQPPLPGNDGQGPETRDACRGEPTDDSFEPPTSLLPSKLADGSPHEEASPLPTTCKTSFSKECFQVQGAMSLLVHFFF